MTPRIKLFCTPKGECYRVEDSGDAYDLTLSNSRCQLFSGFPDGTDFSSLISAGWAAKEAFLNTTNEKRVLFAKYTLRGTDILFSIDIYRSLKDETEPYSDFLLYTGELQEEFLLKLDTKYKNVSISISGGVFQPLNQSDSRRTIFLFDRTSAEDIEVDELMEGKMGTEYFL